MRALNTSYFDLMNLCGFGQMCWQEHKCNIWLWNHQVFIMLVVNHLFLHGFIVNVL